MEPDWSRDTTKAREGAGQTGPVWERLSGTGPLYNNHSAGLAIGPSGTAYLNGGGGIMAIRDAR